MAGKGVKIDIQRLHVRGEMHRPLRAVDHHHHPGGVSKADGLSQVRAAAGDVGHLADGQHPAARGNERAEAGDIRQAVGAEWQLDHSGAGLPGHHQPGHEVGMMLGFANDNFIARLQARPDVALRHHIDGLGGPPRPDDIFAGGGVQPRRHALAGRLIALGQPLGGGELTAVDVAGAQAIKLVAGVDHRLRFERRRRAVEIDAGIGQSRKLRAKVRRVECVHGIPRINTAIVAQFVGRDKASALCGIVRM